MKHFKFSSFSHWRTVRKRWYIEVNVQLEPGAAHLPQRGESRSKRLAHHQLRWYPLGQFAADTGPGVSLVGQDYTGVVTGMSYGATDGLVYSLHTEVLVVDLARQLSIWVSWLGDGVKWRTLGNPSEESYYICALMRSLQYLMELSALPLMCDLMLFHIHLS